MRAALLFVALFFSSSLFALQDEPVSSATDAEAFIADDLYVFMHAGPGRNYRILGSIVAGVPITILQTNTEKEFSEVKDTDGRTGWVENQYISKQLSRRVQLPLINQQLVDSQQKNQQLTSRLATITEQLESARQDIAELTESNSNLLQQNTQFQETLDNVETDTYFKYFTYGGMVAGGGVLLGILLTFMPKRRRREDNWM